jgi:uncharacterized protein involved in exopolysaccharide biosynthesis
MFKRRRMVLLLFLAVFGAANIGNLLRDPVYRASAKVMLTNERAYPEVSPLPRPASVDRPPNETVINSEIQLIRSRDLLRQVHFEIAAQREESGDDRPVPSVQSMENRLSVLRKPSSQVLEIGYRSSQPDEAIEIVNTVVNRYVRYAIEKHNEPEALEFFTKQTEEALSLYQESDVALERYDASHGLTSIAIEKDQMLRQRRDPRRLRRGGTRVHSGARSDGSRYDPQPHAGLFAPELGPVGDGAHQAAGPVHPAASSRAGY